jgi:hypothetical protein
MEDKVTVEQCYKIFEIYEKLLSEERQRVAYLLEKLKEKQQGDNIGEGKVINKVSWYYSEEPKGYHILLDGEQVHFTDKEYERDMFIAELKAKIKIAERTEFAENVY